MDFLDRLLQYVPPETRHQAETELRAQFGGTEPGYIRKHAANARGAGRTRALAEALAGGQPLEVAREALGMSRRTAFRHLGKPSASFAKWVR